MVTDVNLRGAMTGRDLARVCTRERDPAFPFVYMTGTAAEDWARFGVPNSIDLTKPFAPAQLVTRACPAPQRRRTTSLAVGSEERGRALPDRAGPGPKPSQLMTTAAKTGRDVAARERELSAGPDKWTVISGGSPDGSGLDRRTAPGRTPPRRHPRRKKSP